MGATVARTDTKSVCEVRGSVKIGRFIGQSRGTPWKRRRRGSGRGTFHRAGRNRALAERGIGPPCLSHGASNEALTERSQRESARRDFTHLCRHSLCAVCLPAGRRGTAATPRACSHHRDLAPAQASFSFHATPRTFTPHAGASA